MAIFKFLHTPKPKSYQYKPRYYNAEKEDLERRLERSKSSVDPENPEAMKERISRGFKQKFRQDQQFRKKQTKNSNIRLAITIVVLFFLTYILLTKYLPNLEKLLS